MLYISTASLTWGLSAQLQFGHTGHLHGYRHGHLEMRVGGAKSGNTSARLLFHQVPRVLGRADAGRGWRCKGTVWVCVCNGPENKYNSGAWNKMNIKWEHPAAGPFPFFFPAFGWTAKPWGTVNCLGLSICLSLFTSLSLTAPPPLPLEGGGAIRYARFLFPACLTGWARKALMFSDRPPLIVGAFLLCLFCEILT